MDQPLHEQRETSDFVRDHLANNRTMLAWSRTGIAVMALGFVVARFGLLLRALRPNLPVHAPEGVSTAVGTILVIFGGVLIALATLEYLRTGRAITRHEYKWLPALELSLSLVLVLAAAILAIYLAITG